MVVGATAQEREEVRHPVGFAKTEHVAIELGDLFDVGDVERDMAELERHNAFALKFSVREGVTLEHFYDGALRIGEGDRVRDRGLRILLALGFDAVADDLLLELTEVGVGGIWKERLTHCAWEPWRSTTEW